MKKIILIFLFAFAGLSCTTLNEAYWIKTKKRNYYHEQIPPAFENYKIIFISDLHINELLKKKHFERTVQKVNKLNPDLLIFGGDFIDDNTADFNFAYRILNAFTAKDKKLGVFGNHDLWIRSSKNIDITRSTNIEILNNSGIQIEKQNERINIIGVNDYYSGKPNLDLALSKVSPVAFNILISHSPDFINMIPEESQIDLMLCGHTHGGQVTVFGIYAPVMPLYNKKYWHGKYNVKNMTVIITNGIGVYHKSIRFFARPSIEVITLKIK